jgi:hypothetical protein
VPPKTGLELSVNSGLTIKARCVAVPYQATGWSRRGLLTFFLVWSSCPLASVVGCLLLWRLSRSESLVART